jgi:hypothetical protein
LLPLSAAERDCRGVVGRGGRHVLPFLAVAAMLVVVGGLSRPADAQVVTWDFTSTSGSWTQQNVAQVGPPPVKPKWEYGATVLSGTRWSVSSGNTPAKAKVEMIHVVAVMGIFLARPPMSFFMSNE